MTPGEMSKIDSAAPEPVEVLVERAGAAVARTALSMLGGSYGRRVTIIAGPGNNGADGRAAGVRLSERGVRVKVLDAKTCGSLKISGCDLVIDAAYGTGFRDTWDPPLVGDIAVLAVDIPSGIDGNTGQAQGRVLGAKRTVTFAALKPGLLFAQGAELAGTIDVADIGLDVNGSHTHVIEDSDFSARLANRSRDAHKWDSAVWVIAGSPGMTGAAELAVRGAQRAGAGYLRMSTPGAQLTPTSPIEAVGVWLPSKGWANEVIEKSDRIAALVVGPGIGRDPTTMSEVRSLIEQCRVPMVIDGDGLVALCPENGGMGILASRSSTEVILTPHDGEYLRITGRPVGADRLHSARELSSAAGCTVLLKGPTTIVVDPKGKNLLTTTGDSRLATAGSGDVLSGVIAALGAQGMSAVHAGAFGAHLHGRAAALGWSRGLLAGDIPDLVPQALHAMLGESQS